VVLGLLERRKQSIHIVLFIRNLSLDRVILRMRLKRVAHEKEGAKCESMRLLAESLMNASELAGNPS
jgi:hypothetical protein